MPFPVRAILLGLAVTAAGSIPWSILVALNLKYRPSLPWASLVMAAYLIFFLAYLSGWGSPRSTALTRRTNLRAFALSRSIWRWALIAGGSANAALAAAFILVNRFGWIPRHSAPLPYVPAWTMALWLLTGAAVAGISEQCGFRGYMQKMLEVRYSAPVAIAMTSVIFGMAHLTHGLSIALIFDIAWGAIYGVLAYFTGSILPSLVLHSSLDALEFFLDWRYFAPPHPPAVSIDAPAWAALFATLALIALAAFSFRRLHRVCMPIPLRNAASAG